eukprot:CCRYP_000091-RA/>CCRYP_000091-RA protein AED:0.05 eAED:0.05 QI:331/1/1/1/0.83/0.71/7/1515/1505
MTSFLSRIANEATAALSDAYGHVMHGDDAGSSARLVWVVHPTRVAVQDAGGELGGTAADRLAAAKVSAVMNNEGSVSPGRGGNNFRYTQKFDLGLTFLEINDRAYVRTVSPNSPAFHAGIQPQDCVQFACVVGGPQFSSYLDSISLRQSVIEENEAKDQLNSPGNSTGSNHRERRRTNGRVEREELEKERIRLDEKASQFAFECEKRGMRTSYEELRNLFVGCTLPPKDVGQGGVNMEGNKLNDAKLRESLNSTPQRKASASAFAASTASRAIPRIYDDLTLEDTNSLLMADSIGGMFETGKSHKYNLSSRCVPTLPDNKTAKVVTQNVTNAARNAAGCFMTEDRDNLDEDGEGGEFFGDHRHRSRRSNGPILLDTPSSPIKSKGIPSPRRQRVEGGGDGIVYAGELEQQLYPVVMVFRRTVQRKQLISSRKGLWGSPGLSLRGSLFGIPSFRMDDECDRAAALVRQLAPSNSNKRRRGGIDSSGIFYDDGENSTVNDSSVATSPDRGAGFSGAANDDNIEASTIRGMIQNAVGLGFVRTSKVVVGVSLQAGSGIIIARLPDGTWSAPSAIGVYGLGVGMQFGLEVADYMFILQTKEGVEHFQRGGNFAVGGNIGISVANCGREAYGAASLGACAGSRNLEDQIQQGDSYDEGDNGSSSVYDDTTNASSTIISQKQQKKNKKDFGDVAPMVAYAKSQGLYFGVSVDGLKFFTRNDINARAYKFSMLSEMAAKDILSGLVAPPPEAEDLYAALHSVEYVHDVTELPRPPSLLRKDAMNDWRFDRSIVARKGEIFENNERNAGYPLYSFLTTLNAEEADEFAIFETKFKKFLYGGVAVQRLLPNSPPTRSGLTRRERRTLWLMLPEVGSLRLGFVSRLKDGSGDTATMDDMTTSSSIAPSRTDDDDRTIGADTANVKLSSKQSMSLTDITLLSQDPNVTVRLSPDDATEHLRIISIEDVTGKSLLFIASSNHEAELLVCGLKLLLECESARLGVRGGVPLNKLGGKLNKDAVSPSSARGSVTSPSSSRARPDQKKKKRLTPQSKADLDDRSKYSSIGEPGSSSDSENNNEKDARFAQQAEIAKLSEHHLVPEGRSSWSQVPSRSHMRQAANGSASPRRQPKIPTYELGKEICNDVATNISLPMPLAICRVLFLDSTSPVIKAWEGWRGDQDYRRTDWMFTPDSPREFDKNMSEQELISRGSMAGGQRTVSYGRMRNQELVRLSETIVVEQDDNQTLVFSIIDRMPRRGFSAKVRISIRSFSPQSCEARVVTELRPAGKNLSDQQAVHKAFILVLDEMKMRYGVEGKGLLAVFLDLYSTATSPSSTLNNSASPKRAQSRPSPPNEVVSPSKTSGTRNSSMTSFKDVLPHDAETTNANTMKQFSRDKSQPSPSRTRAEKKQDRPSTPSMQKFDSKRSSPSPKPSIPIFQKTVLPQVDEFADFSNFESTPKNPNPVTVEVKPLPKIRLDLCPVPREEDEEEDSSLSASDAKMKKKSKHSKHKHRRRTPHG